MGNKRRERERRKALKQKDFETNKAAFIAKVNASQQPKILVEPIQNDSPRIAPHLERATKSATKNPVATKDGSRFDSKVTWCITKADQDGTWSWNEPRAWTENEWSEVIHPSFLEFERRNWGEIDDFSSGSEHKMHHSDDLDSLNTEAQKRWLALDLEQFDSVFRFRLGSTKRAWGYIAQAHFHMVWWERNHMIYET